MKTIALLILGSDSEPVEIVVAPGVTASDILAQAGLAECCLARMGEQNYFHPEEAIYDQIQDGDTLYAVLPACELY